MKREKLLIVTDDANMGGTYRVAEQLVLGLAARFDVRFACAFEAKNAASRETIARYGVCVTDYRASERNPQRAAFALEDAQQLIDSADPDCVLLVEGGEIWSLLAVKAVAAERGIPYVPAINLLTDDCVRRFPELRAQAIEALRGAQAIVFVSDASRRRFEALLPPIERPKLVVANSRPARFFEIGGIETREAKRRALGLRDDETAFLCAARIEPRKGQILCLEALECLRARGKSSGLRVVLAGGGESGDVETLQTAIRDKGLADHVLLLGPRDDMPSLLEACDAFVLPSYSEGMPLSIIEAMAKGRAVIATAVDGIPEQIDRLSGVLLPSPTQSRDGCVEALAEAMTSLRDNPRARAEMGRCARLRAVELFQEERMIGEYESILSEAALHARPKGRLAAMLEHPLLRDTMSGRERLRLRGRRPSLPPLSRWTEAREWLRIARMRAIHEDFCKGSTFGSTIEFYDPAQCWSYAQDGWDVAETVGCWSDGAISTIRLRLRPGMDRLRLVFDLTPFAPPGHRQETDVLIDGELLAAWAFDAQVWGRHAIDIPNRRATGRSLEIRLVHKRTFSPRAAGLSEDSRELGIYLHRIEIERLPLRVRLRELSRIFDIRMLALRRGARRVPAE